MKITENFFKVIIDLDFKEYAITFEDHKGFEYTVKGICSPNVNEAIEQAEISFGNYLLSKYGNDTDDYQYTADEYFEKCSIVKIERIL